ncbi:unnamed protein product [Rotaria sordida]|uniref:PhoD-like phosphatase domain-containing protein n=1 Tax=Rotaria sordida TaxID=392033 RepID=A0A818ZR75_9BILA|nr:unnamed protein product [Rotaria sordida]
MPWNEKWTYDFDESRKKAEHWEYRPEMKRALGSIPSIMMWDDHDIFDSAGSYSPLLHQSPIMKGLFEMAQKIRLLFQHHTTPEKAREHRLFSYQGHNLLARCGPNLLILAADGQTEQQVNSIFGLSGTYDDLLDEWTHVNHITERNDVLQRFQNLAEINKIRVTFFSSGVHCCGVSRF